LSGLISELLAEVEERPWMGFAGVAGVDELKDEDGERVCDVD
jgi:hypothetical protein